MEFAFVGCIGKPMQGAKTLNPCGGFFVSQLLFLIKKYERNYIYFNKRGYAGICKNR